MVSGDPDTGRVVDALEKVKIFVDWGRTNPSRWVH